MDHPDYLDLYKNKLKDLRLLFDSNEELATEFNCSVRTVTSLMNSPKLSTVLLRSAQIDKVHKKHFKEIELKKARLNK